MKVVAAIDASPTARHVLDVAPSIAQLFGARAEALHVDEGESGAALATAEAAGFPLVVVSGPPVACLIAAGAASDVSALVLGARGASADGRPAGDTALEVITALAMPIVVVPPDTPVPFRLRRILVPLDGTQATATALDETIRLTRRAEIELLVLHVYDEDSLPLFTDQPQHELASFGDEFLARSCGACPADELTFELRVGDPAEHCLRLTAGREADLVALAWSRDLAGGRAAVVRTLLARAQVPVLLVPIDGAATGLVRESLR